MPQSVNYIIAFIVSLAVVLIATPAIGRWCPRFGLVDKPNERRINKTPVPNGGGIAIYLGFLASALLFGRDNTGLLGILLGGTVILAIGILDDRFELSPGIKLAGQVVAAIIVVGFGTKIQFVTNPLGGMIYLGNWSVPATVFWLVAMINVINFIDGLDGLAAGVSAIACVPLFVIALGRDQTFVAILTISLAGAAVGFLRYNFNPARIFMGDAGAMFLGLMLGAISVEGALKGATTIALAVPIVVLGVPIFDTAFAIIRRFLRKEPVYVADNQHIHHRLLALGFSQRQAVVIMYTASGLLALLALALSYAGTLLATLGLVAIILIFLLAADYAGLLGDRQTHVHLPHRHHSRSG